MVLWLWRKLRASGLRPRCQSVGWRWAVKGPLQQDRKLQCQGANLRAAPMLEIHQAPGWERPNPSLRVTSTLPRERPPLWASLVSA